VSERSRKAEAAGGPVGLGTRGTPWIRPWRLGSRIHAADTPAYPTRPASDRFWRSATHGEEREDQKRVAALRLLVNRAWLCRSSWPAPFGPSPWATLAAAPAAAFGSTQGNEAPRQAAFAFDLLFLLRGWTRTETVRGAGAVGSRDRWRHGWRHRAPRDGFTACPANPPRPPQLHEPLFATTYEGLRRWLETSWLCATPVVKAFSWRCTTARPTTKVRKKR